MDIRTIRDNAGISNDRLMATAPAVFAAQAHEGTSSKYRFIPTLAVVNGLRDAGWVPVMAQVQRVRDGSRNGFQKHLLKFQQENAWGKFQGMIEENRKRGERDPYHPVGWSAKQTLGVIPELLLTNSHDGSSSYVLRGGLFRVVCLNGLVVSAGDFGTIRVRHTGGQEVVKQVIGGSHRFVEGLPRIIENVERFQEVKLERSEQLALAQAAMVARYGQEEVQEKQMKAEGLLRVRRDADREPTLWNTYNVVQENLLKGGARVEAMVQVPSYRDPEKKVPVIKRLRVREVKGIDSDVRLNQALWTLTEKLAQVKQQAA